MGLLKQMVERLQGQFVHPVHPQKNQGAQRKPAPILAVHCVHPVHPQNNDAGTVHQFSPMPSAPAPAPIPAPAHTPEQAANDSTVEDWRTLDRAYMDHHMTCTQCKTAGRRRGDRCAVGAALWRAYEAAEPPFADKRVKT